MIMKKSIFIAAALFAAISCQSLKEEFQPVFSNPGDSYDAYKQWTDDEIKAELGVEAFTTIAQMKSLYRAHGTPVEINKDMVIRGEITTSDSSRSTLAISGRIFIRAAMDLRDLPTA